MGLFEKNKTNQFTQKTMGTMSMSPTEQYTSNFTSEELLKRVATTPPQPQVSSPEVGTPQNRAASPTAGINTAPRPATPKPAPETKPLPEKVNPADVLVCKQSSGLINEVKFSDVYVTPDKKCYIWSGRTNCGLKIVTFDDFDEFFRQLEAAYDGENRSYLLNYLGRNYRVERTIALEGVNYCARKMPTSVPNLKDLGMPYRVYEHLVSLAGCSGLILLAGATGSGKSTTVSALLKEYLQKKGGYAFTIEDPIEMPLDGVYVTPDAELGLCKQTTPPDGKWEEGIKSALRSKPRYIYLGEIRSPDVASEALRAATSGHLVLSTIHSNNVSDAINALVKYAASSGISEDMAYELVANGFLGCIHQILEGAPKRAKVSYLFANPDVNAACQVRGMLRSGKLNMGTLLEQQRVKIERGLSLF
ncbi:MAG: ATPase, T2SS/T4P/T4SS family [Alphaproteobacteria bacterium]|nr:ATPase, T2SS/T4P/T4SS family [Alphaproteobacteria bacterium]